MKNPSPLAAEFMDKGKSESCPVYDMHAHYGPSRVIWFPTQDADTMVRTMDQCGVRMLFLVSHTSLSDPRRGNPINVEAVRRHPDRLRAYWAINPNYPKVIAADLKEFPKSKEFIGFKFLSDYHRYPIDGENYRPVLEYAEATRGLILMHTWGFSQYDGPKLVEKVAQKYPNVTILMGHSGCGEWDVSIRVAREHPNVYLELTGVAHPPGVIEKLVAGAGSHKMLFGTDMPWFDPHYLIGCLLFARITDDDRHNILHRNAEKLLSGRIQPLG